MAETLDYFLPNVLSQETKKRIETGEDLLDYLRNKESSLYCEEMDKFVDGLSNWVSCSSFKVSLLGLDVISCLIDRMAGHFKPHVTTVLPVVIDRLGDSKEQVRENARELLLKLMTPASSPQYVVDRLNTALTHKLWKVKEETLICLQTALDRFGAKNLSLSKTVPLIVKLLDDQSIPTREQAMTTLVEIYKHVGERLRVDLAKKDISSARLNVLFARMDEVRSAGQMLISDDCGDDETDSNAVSSKLPKRSSSSSRTSSGIGVKSSKTSSAAASAGALDEEAFIKVFEEVPKIYISSAKDVTDRMNKIRETLSDVNADWEKRVDCIKELRSLFIAGASEYADYQQLLRSLEPSLRTSVQDLRSQVVREMCISIAYLSQQLGKEFDHVAEALLPSLIQLIPNSAKIMSTSGVTAIRFIVQFTHIGRLIPLITTNITSKSAIIRRQCCDFIDLVVHTWPTSVLERQASALYEVIKKGLADADPDARVHSRRAFWGFEAHFKDQASALFNSLDSSQQKQLQSAQPVSSSSSSTSSLNAASKQPQTSLTAAASKAKSRSRSISNDRSATTGHSRMVLTSGHSTLAAQSAAKASRVPRDTAVTDDGVLWSGASRSKSAANGSASSTYCTLRHSQSTSELRVGLPSKTPTLRRNQSLRTRAAASPVAPKSSNASRNKKSSIDESAQSAMTPDRRQRTRNGTSQSQPGSRSGSPSSRLSYITHTQPDVVPTAPSAGTASRVRSRIPHSQGSSRDASPLRVTGVREKKSVSGHPAGRVSLAPPQTDSDLQNAAALLQRVGSFRRPADEFDDAASETSSLCSESSYRSYGNIPETLDPSERRALMRKAKQDVADIIANLTSGVWSDRRDGLIALQNFLQANRRLSRSELKKISEIFTRMFHDPHLKVFSVFMDTFVDFITIYHTELTDWLHIALTRLFNKMAIDVVGSVQSKMLRALDVIRDVFPCEHQFNVASKFIVDQTQIPNVKVKVAVLNYIHSLSLTMDPSDLVNTSDTRLALTRIITWTTEPKSSDVRKAAQAALITLFNVNTPELTTMLRAIPKTFQESATRILQGHIRTTGLEMSEPLSPRNVTSPSTTNAGSRPRNLSGLCTNDTENLNPEDVYNSIRKASADIQNLSQPHTAASRHAADVVDTSRLKAYNPNHYQDDKSNGAPTGLPDVAVTADGDIFNEEFPADGCNSGIEEIIAELSNHNTRNTERKQSMKQLIRITRDAQVDIWSEHFKTILLLLLETFADTDDEIRAWSLRVLREIVRRQPERFSSYAELTILKLLEAHKDSVKDVIRAAEECAATVARAIPPDQCINILNPFIDSTEFPVNYAAIKMEIKVIEATQDKDVVKRLLPELVPRLLKGYENSESSVRKASVFCLVAIYLVVGEELRPFLSSLSTSKLKLLNLYIKRALSQKVDNSSTDTSKTSSPVSVVENFC